MYFEVYTVCSDEFGAFTLTQTFRLHNPVYGYQRHIGFTHIFFVIRQRIPSSPNHLGRYRDLIKLHGLSRCATVIGRAEVATI